LTLFNVVTATSPKHYANGNMIILSIYQAMPNMWLGDYKTLCYQLLAAMAAFAMHNASWQ